MNRWATYLLGPETVLTIITFVIFTVCARHSSGEGKDVELLEKILMGLAFWVVPLVFATVSVPGARNWWWLGRAIGLTSIMLLVIACRLISGFGTGAKGQDAAFILVMILGIVMISLCAAVSGGWILFDLRPGFANWFRNHRFVGSLLVAAGAIPIAIALGLVQIAGVTLVASVWSSFKR
ncbi:MAG TPA: hypothetical protein VEH04_08780 [Verrucomicrobiae bacterium]|nr:hypothetical protein [Verrucomicrobiae bacterium]